MADDREIYKPKHALGVPAKRRPDPFGSTPTVDATAAAEELARRERERPQIRTPSLGVKRLPTSAGVIPPPVRASSEPESWDDQSGSGRHVTAVKPRTDHESPLETITRYAGTTVNTTTEILDRLARQDRELEAQRHQNTHILSILDNREHIRARTESKEIALSRAQGEALIASGALKREAFRKFFDRFVVPILTAIATYVVLKLTGRG